MTATEVLRRLLDERGVEWWQSVNMLGCVFTRWYSPLFSDEVVAIENGDGELELFSHLMTPEQAIAATLGCGECVNMDGETDAEWFTCSECNTEIRVHEPFDAFSIHYCPNCGRKVVSE